MFFYQVLFIGFWCLCLVVSVGFVYLYAGAETSTIHRKFFHIVMCIVYFPAILYDLNFMFICSVAVLYGFVVLEVSTPQQLNETALACNVIIFGFPGLAGVEI